MLITALKMASDPPKMPTMMAVQGTEEQVFFSSGGGPEDTGNGLGRGGIYLSSGGIEEIEEIEEY